MSPGATSPHAAAALPDSEPELYDALVEAARTKWTTTDELLAGIYELTHANYRVLLGIGGVKQRDIPKPLRVPRPGEAKQTKKKASGAELARWVRARKGG